MGKRQTFDNAFCLSRQGFVFIIGGQKKTAAHYVLNLRGAHGDQLLTGSWPSVCCRLLFIIAHPQIKKMRIWQILSDVQGSIDHQTFFGHTAQGFLQNGRKEIFAIGTFHTGYLICELQTVSGDNSPLLLPFGETSITWSIFKPANNAHLEGLIYLLAGWGPTSQHQLKYFKSQNDLTDNGNIW